MFPHKLVECSWRSVLVPMTTPPRAFLPASHLALVYLSVQTFRLVFTHILSALTVCVACGLGGPLDRLPTGPSCLPTILPYTVQHCHLHTPHTLHHPHSYLVHTAYTAPHTHRLTGLTHHECPAATHNLSHIHTFTHTHHR